MRFGVKIGQWGWRYDELVAGWVAAEDAGFALVSCWDHAVAAPAGLAAWDAPSLLTAMAGATRQVRLGTHVINTALRHPFLLAAQLAVAQAASGGRIEAGLGVGGATHLAGHVHHALGVPLLPFADRLRRLEACLRIFPALWRGETVDEPVLGLRAACLGPLNITPPPLVVGGTGPHTMAVAARYADGWNVTGPTSPDQYHPLAERMRRLCDQARRDRPLRYSVQLFTRDLDWPGLPTLINDFAAAGADELIFVPDHDRLSDELHRLTTTIGLG